MEGCCCCLPASWQPALPGCPSRSPLNPPRPPSPLPVHPAAAPSATTALAAPRLHAALAASTPFWARAPAAPARCAVLMSPTPATPPPRARLSAQCPWWTLPACTRLLARSTMPHPRPASHARPVPTAPPPMTPCPAWPGEQPASQPASQPACLHVCLSACWGCRAGSSCVRSQCLPPATVASKKCSPALPCLACFPAVQPRGDLLWRWRPRLLHRLPGWPVQPQRGPG